MVAEDGEHHMIGGDFVVGEHDVTAGLNWKWVASRWDLRLSTAGPPAGWSAVVSVGNRPLVAVAPGGRRAVWVGFKSDEFERSPGFVVFWANLLTWVGGEERFGNGYVIGATLEMQRVEGDGDWLPGLYRDGDGQFHAVNAADVQARGGDADEWKARVAEVVRNAEGKWALGPWVMVVAGGLFAAALFARRK